MNSGSTERKQHQKKLLASSTSHPPPLPKHVDPATAPRPGMLHISQALRISCNLAKEQAGIFVEQQLQEQQQQQHMPWEEHIVTLGCWAAEHKVLTCFDSILEKMADAEETSSISRDAAALNQAVGNITFVEEAYRLLLLSSTSDQAAAEATVDQDLEAIVQRKRVLESAEAEDEASGDPEFQACVFRKLLKQCISKNTDTRDSIIAYFSESDPKILLHHRAKLWTSAGKVIGIRQVRNAQQQVKQLWDALCSCKLSADITLATASILESSAASMMMLEEEKQLARDGQLVQMAFVLARGDVLLAEFSKQYAAAAAAAGVERSRCLIMCVCVCVCRDQLLLLVLMTFAYAGWKM